MSAPITARWYVVDGIGRTTVCNDKADAENVASEMQRFWPEKGPYSAVLLGDVAAERAARIESQRQVEALQERIKHAEVETAKAVAAERERCADLAFVMVSKYLPTSPCRDALSRVSAAIRKGDAA